MFIAKLEHTISLTSKINLWKLIVQLKDDESTVFDKNADNFANSDENSLTIYLAMRELSRNISKNL